MIEVRRGDDMALRASVTDAADAAQDLTDWVVSAQMLYPACPPVDCAAAWIDPAAGVASITLTEIQTPDLHLGDYELRIRLTSPTGITTSAPAVTVTVTD